MNGRPAHVAGACSKAQTATASLHGFQAALGMVQKSIFSRAIGLNSVFTEPPDETTVSPEFIRNYFRFADHMFACRQQMQAFTEVTVENFYFDIYASGEYSRILEKAWGE